MASTHEAQWAVLRSGFWEALGEMFAAPFSVFAWLFDPEGERERVIA